MANPDCHGLMRRACQLATALAWLLLPACVTANSDCVSWDSVSDPTTLTTAIIGRVNIRIDDVFDETSASENMAIHRLANRLHRNTRRSVIEKQLLFASGDPFDPGLLEETERLLRTNSFLRSASVRPTALCTNEVDIDVRTGDNWSLIPGVGFSRAGGQNRYAFRVSENNLFGTGKSLDLELDYGPDRDQQLLLYRDPLLLGTRNRLEIQLQDNTDGEVQLLDVQKPFFALDGRRAWRLRAFNSEYIQSLYDDGVVINRVGVDNEVVTVNTGFSRGSVNNQVVRWRVGWLYQRKQLDAAVEQSSTEHVYSYPLISMQWLRPHFIKRENHQLMESVEDVAIGDELFLSLGFASESTGSSRDALIVVGDYSRGWQPHPSTLLLARLEADGMIADRGFENALAETSLRGFVQQGRKTSLYILAKAAVSRKLLQDRQIVLGGGTGLRGYPLRFQTGEFSALLTLEQRYYFDWYPLRAVRVGAAAFADVGSAWSRGEEIDWQRDAGLGLRLVSTRQANANVMHIDFAFPLDSRERVEGFQLVVTAKTRF